MIGFVLIFLAVVIVWVAVGLGVALVLGPAMRDPWDRP